ncbi:dTMP kinase [candidate division KSB1 bacterium]|nr:MAG: dTMP kinase [candidate division KSB1 bacterium]
MEDFKGYLITFEGIDGSGKSVQAQRLYNNLKKQGLDPLLIREPGGTEVSEKIRDILLLSERGSVSPVTELMLYEAARAELVSRIIFPALKDGRVVISDRFTDSTVAYQGFGRGLDIDLIEQINFFVCRQIKPHLTIILDITLEESLRRRNSISKKEDRIEKETSDFFSAVITGYKSIADSDTNRAVLFDGSLPVDKLEQMIFERVKQTISL